MSSMSQLEKAQKIAQSLGMRVPISDHEPIGDFYLDAILRVIQLIGEGGEKDDMAGIIECQ